ncbi:MAG: tape measure protein [Romboutsia timonensis]
MATISSTFKMQDNATSTLNNVSKGLKQVIDQADTLAAKAPKLGTGGLNSQLYNAVSQYRSLTTMQDTVNAKIEKMNAKQRKVTDAIRKQMNAEDSNGKAIERNRKKVRAIEKEKQRLIKTSDKLTSKILNQATAVDKVAKNTSKIKSPTNEVTSGLGKWGARITVFNQGLQLAQRLGTAVKAGLDYTDNLALNKARLNLMNDGLQTTEELQNKIFAASQRSRGSYDDMTKSVAKLGLLAGDAFNNNDEMIAFSEMMQKSFKVSGASNQEISSATYQLTQAMAAGKLQGDEFRSIMENAPMLADAIAKYMGKSKGELKELSSEGVITSDIIKNALFSAADDINAKYEQMPKTFADAMTNIKNNAQKTLQPVADKISNILNSPQFQSMVNIIINGLAMIGNAIVWLMGVGNNIYAWAQDHLPVIKALLFGIGVYMGVVMVKEAGLLTFALLKQAGAWLLAHSQMILVIGALAIAYYVFQSTGSILTTLAVAIALVAGAMAIWHIVQWALNGAMYACPIVWIIVLIIALIAVIYLVLQWIGKTTKVANSGLGMIAGGVNVVIQFFKNLGLTVANIGLGIWNVLGAVASNIGTAFKNTIKNIQSWFYGLLSTALTVVEGICKALNKLPFVDIDYSGITSKAKEYANKAKEAEDSKEDYKNLMDEFNKGMNTFETFQDGWASDAFQQGAAWGDGIAEKIDNAIGSFDPSSLLGDVMGDLTKGQDFGDGYDFSSMIDPNGNIPVDVKKNSDKEVDISDEDLKMLKDIATREYMLNYKHITPNVNIEFGDIKETADVNQVKDAITKMMEEELAELYVVEEG